MEDQELDRLARAALQGDRMAWHELYAAVTPRLFRFVGRLAPAAEAEEIVQATWVRVFERRERYDESRSFRVWIFTVAHNLWVSAARSASKLKTIPLPGDDALETPAGRHVSSDLERVEEECERENLIRRIADCQKTLTEEYRLIIRLRFRKGLGMREIGEQLKQEESQIRGKCYRAIQKLIGCMDP